MELTLEHLSIISLTGVAVGVLGTIVASIALHRSGCILRDEGVMLPPGPPGPRGPVGLTGERGPIGPQGLPGKDAVAPKAKPRGRPRKAKAQSKKPRD